MTDSKDAKGKRALFETPPIQIDDPLADDPLVDHDSSNGYEALYSAGGHEPGTAVIICSDCRVHSRVGLVETVVRIMALTLWIPGRSYSRLIPCPACQNRTWCKVVWHG